MANKQKQETAKKLTAEEELQFIKTAPITKVAAYFGGDIDLAVKLRVDEAVDETYRKLGKTRSDLEVTVRPIEPQGNLYGFASVTIGSIRIDDFKIVENKNGELFVGMPSKPDKTSTTGYRNTVFVAKEYQYDFNAAVIGAYHEAVEQVQNRAASLRKAPREDPIRIAAQMYKASKEAEKHNATHTTPATKRSRATHDDR